MATITNRIGPADHGRAMTLEEFREAEEETGYLYELARGVLEVTEVPADDHGQTRLREVARRSKATNFPEEIRMPSDLTSYFEKRREYLANRTIFPLDELAKYAGQWIAWSPDGLRIVAHATDPQSLDDLVRAVGEDPEECLVEGIPADDSVIGGVEFDRGRE